MKNKTNKKIPPNPTRQKKYSNKTDQNKKPQENHRSLFCVGQLLLGTRPALECGR